MDHDISKKVLRKICVDVLLVFIVGIPILVFFLFGKPYERGFFCNDESLLHPYHDSTVPSWTLYLYGLALPILVMIIVEFFSCPSNAKPIVVYNVHIPYWVWRSYCAIVVFGFGAACSQLSTDIMKYTVGRLRPHFFHVCRPTVNCTDPANVHRYIEDFQCENDKEGRKLKEMRLSFPSGHSSFSMYTMFYLAMYLQSRWKWRTTLLLRNALQYSCILLAIYVAMTRISDYKHHWSDVLAGLLLGMFCAVLVGRFCSDLFIQKRPSLMSLSHTENYDAELNQHRNGITNLEVIGKNPGNVLNY